MIGESDRMILRDLAKRVAEIAALPVQDERRRRWKKHNSLQGDGPMILIFPEGSWRELLPGSALRCEGRDARGIEWQLRSRIYYHEHFRDDTVIEAQWVVGKVVRNSGWGLAPRRIDSPETRGAWKFDPVVTEPADLKKLRAPEITWDEAATDEHLAAAQDLLGDILDVKLKGVSHVSYHLMSHYTRLRGLAEVMMDMVAEPRWLHEAMAILEAGHHGILRQYVEHNLLDLNNDNTYHSSGGNGWTDELPADGFDPARVRPRDMWASAESQEMAQVSPEMHAEFVLQYENRLLAPFGLTGYGCCEDLTLKLDDVLAIPNIRRISISPWADVDACAERLGKSCIFSWKPNPAMLVGVFDTDRVREYIAHAIAACGAGGRTRSGCALEIILKDTHTCENRPERFDRWCRIAREQVDRKR